MDILVVKLTPIGGNASSMLRTKAMVKGLVENGHNVTFITLLDKKGIDNDSFLQKVNFIYLSNPMVSNYQETMVEKNNSKRLFLIRKIWHAIIPFDSSYLLLKQLTIKALPDKKFDILISSSDPKTAHLVIKKLINEGLQYKKWIQYWGDPLTIDITSKLIFPKFVLKRLEARLFANSDKIIYVSPFTYQTQIKLFYKYASRMLFLPIPYYKELVFPNIINTKYEIGYFGDYSTTSRNIIPLINAVNNLDSSRYHLFIIGYGNIKINNSENIDCYYRKDIETFEAKTNLFICILNSSGTQIPGKIYHCAATNKPILIVLDGENGKMIKEYFLKFDRFYFCDNNEYSIIQAINIINKENKLFSPVKDFSSSIIAQKIIE